MTDTYMGYCSWCGGLNLPIQKIVHLYYGNFYMRTLHSMCWDEEYESYAPIREYLHAARTASLDALMELMEAGNK